MQIRTWIEGTLGPDIRVAERPVQAVPEGDHYRLGLPIRVTRSFKPDTIMLSGSARPISGGRWAIEDWRFPSPSSFTVQVPAPNDGTPKTGQKAPRPPIPVDYTISAGSQDSQGVYDPSFATPSTLATSVQDLRIAATSALTEQLTTTRRLVGTNTMRPSGADRVDLITDSTLEGYTLNSKIDGGQPVDVMAETVHASGQATAVSRGRLARAIPALMRVNAGDREIARIMVAALQGLASELTLQEAVDGLIVHYGPYGGAASQMRVGLGVKSEDGLLQGHMDLGLDGLVLTGLPLGGLADLLPHRIALRPTFSGIPTQYFLQSAAAKANAKDAGPPPEYASLFSRGGISAGLDNFAFDVGGTSFAGNGALMMASPQQTIGQAQVTATNFDDLIQRANDTPELARMLPALVFAKGISRTVDGRLVWEISYRDDKLLVNGTDLSSMAGSRPPTRIAPGPGSH